MPASAVLTEFPPRTQVRVRRLTEIHRPMTRHLVAVPDQPARVERIPPAPTQVELCRLLTAILEVLGGHRPASQIDGLLPVLDQQALVRAEPGAHRLRSVHPSRTSAEVLDLCARIDQRDRSRALVGRMEFQENRWRFTLLRLL